MFPVPIGTVLPNVRFKIIRNLIIKGHRLLKTGNKSAHIRTQIDLGLFSSDTNYGGEGVKDIGVWFHGTLSPTIEVSVLDPDPFETKVCTTTKKGFIVFKNSIRYRNKNDGFCTGKR